MSTNVATISQREVKQSPIRFFKVMQKRTMQFTSGTTEKPAYYNNILLLVSKFGSTAGTDLMLAYNNGKEDNAKLFLGDFGTGLVEPVSSEELAGVRSTEASQQ